ncbi:hypothetical protein Vadar_000793 [Vaccinium darrowii]|uniref:Uncharacterized protein n=1 Tax=Vaccinium darrowii TaxID=229202 RepID=A0ACB7WX27_9ERIC|nr:hypothetical protein Vadar_000793 [Vaccinium darrowii]
MTTSDPSLAIEIHHSVAAKSCSAVDAPVPAKTSAPETEPLLSSRVVRKRLLSDSNPCSFSLEKNPIEIHDDQRTNPTKKSMNQTKDNVKSRSVEKMINCY